MTSGNNYVLEPRKFVAPEFVCGTGVLNLVGRYAQNYGARKVFLVSDAGVRQAGWTRCVEESLGKNDIPFAVFEDVTPNPKEYEVMLGAELYWREQCDVIVAVGGGSPIDCAKGIGIVATNNRNILEFEGVDEVPVPGPPMICIPTTAGTGADVSQFAIIADTSRKVKIAIVSKYLIADVSLIDPATTSTMPPALTAATGMDALTHAVEAYVSTASSPMTDLHALEAIRLIRSSLESAVHQPERGPARANMMLGSLFAGLAFSNAGLGVVHAMAHSLGGLLDLPHGECNAILLEQSVRINFEAASHRYLQIAKAFGIETRESDAPDDAKERLMEALAEFRGRVGIHLRLSDMGLEREDISVLAEHALGDPCLVTNPKTGVMKDIVDCYEQVF